MAERYKTDAADAALIADIDSKKNQPDHGLTVDDWSAYTRASRRQYMAELIEDAKTVAGMKPELMAALVVACSMPEEVIAP